MVDSAVTGFSNNISNNTAKQSVQQAYAATNGWVPSGNYWFYYQNGAMLRSQWKEILHSGRLDYFYFNKDGTMATGWLVYDGSWFYLADGSQDVGFYDSDYGVMRTEWQRIYNSGRWDHYYFKGNGSGRMVAGWLPYDGSWFYFADGKQNVGFYDSNYGVMRTNWAKINSRWYYFRGEGSGRMQTGWLPYSGNYYFLDTAGGDFYSPDYGVMLAGKDYKIGNHSYYFAPLYGDRWRYATWHSPNPNLNHPGIGNNDVNFFPEGAMICKSSFACGVYLYQIDEQGHIYWSTSVATIISVVRNAIL